MVAHQEFVIFQVNVGKEHILIWDTASLCSQMCIPIWHWIYISVTFSIHYTKPVLAEFIRITCSQVALIATPTKKSTTNKWYIQHGS